MLVILLLFGTLEFLVPIRTTVQIGADEGFELAKATLCLKGYKLYAEVWNDHAPLHTFLITALLKHVSPSVAGPRLLTMAFAALLVTSVFLIAFHLGSMTRSSRPKEAPISFNSPNGQQDEYLNGLLCAVITSLLFIASPGFLELSSSCMLEIPSVAPAVAALYVLFSGWGQKWYSAAVIAGMLFGISLAMKLIGVVLLPVAALVLWARFVPLNSFSPSSLGGEGMGEQAQRLFRFLLPFEAVRSFAILTATCALTFVGLDLAIDGGAFLRHFHQSWMSHFAPAISSEYGSPNDHPFPFTLLLKNWDLTIPTAIAVFFLLRKSLPRSTPDPRPSTPVTRHWRVDPWKLVPVLWLAFSLALFTIHKPWWAYYYIHIAIPLSLCAGFGLARIFEHVSGLVLLRTASRPGSQLRSRAPLAKSKSATSPIATAAIFALYSLCTLFWISTRAYLEISEIRNSPQTYYALVLNEIDRFKPFTQWIYTDKLVYSFYSRIPVPPQLAVIPLKRLWSGEMTNARIRNEVQKYKPGLVVLRNDSRETPFQDLLNSEYRLVYQDPDNRLYAHKSIANKPDMAAQAKSNSEHDVR